VKNKSGIGHLLLQALVVENQEKLANTAAPVF
jgi:hypothetical protein